MRPLDTPLLPLLLSVGDIVIVTDDDNEGETVTVGVELCAMVEERVGVMLHWAYSDKSKPS